MIGKTLGHYEITAHLGTGGMGEVYRATDTTLGREVAIKVLPEAVSSDPERVARFQREARTLASLHHPHVASIFGFEESQRTRYLVMELVEGETLAQRVQRGPVAIDDAVSFACQIAEGLEHAHEKGIVHRDLKLANVKVTPEGQAKILDFGLARAFLGEPEAEEMETSPTITAAMTQAGVILGTAAYMSPEQAKGKPVDKRADIWAFGVIVFEMLIGQPLFRGETTSETLAAVLTADVDWAKLPRDTPPTLAQVLRRCLDKDPKERLRDIGEARIALSGRLDATSQARPTTASRRLSLWVLGLLLAASVVGNVLLLGHSGSEPGSSGKTLHLTIALPADAPLARARAYPLGIGRNGLTISPDGMTLVYVAEVGGDRRLFLRRLDEALARELPGTSGALLPKFSPGGDWIGFCTGRQIKKVAPAGGTPITLCELPNVFGLVWENDTTLLAAAQQAKEIFRVDVDSGRSSHLLTSPERVDFDNFALLPGSAYALADYDVDRSLDPGSSDVAAVSLADGSMAVLAPGGVLGQFVPTGHLVYMRGGTLMAIRFDPDQRKSFGRPVPVVTDMRVGSRATPSIAFAANGILAYVSGSDELRSDLVWVDPDGNERKAGIDPQIFGDFQISPDGHDVAATVGGDRNEIWIYDLATGARRKLTVGGDGRSPVWSPDGRRIAFGSYRGGGEATYLIDADGGGSAQPLEVNGMTGRPYAWTTDGQLAVTQPGLILLLDLQKDAVRTIDNPNSFEWGPAVSPDDRYIAYTSDESGRYEVYVREMHSLSQAWAISVDGGEEPIWSRDGTELYFRNGDTWLRADIETQPVFRASRPRTIVTGAYENAPGRSYDVSPSGELLLIRNRSAETFSRQIEVVLNWFDELKRLVDAQGSTGN